MKKRNYLLERENSSKKIIHMDYTKIGGFKFNPKNQIEYDGIMVNEMVVINPSFIESILKRKTKKKLELYLKFVINLLDEDNSSSSDDLREALNGLVRYKSVVKSKYSKYLEERYLKILLKKIELLEQEITTKIIYAKEPVMEESKKTR